MKTIGLIGGMSWESSLEYYRIINEEVKGKLGGAHSCQCIMYSVDFAEYESLLRSGDWQLLADNMIDIAKKLEGAGAELILICTNTMHKIAESIEKNVNVPLVHIADSTAEEIKAKNMSKVGLLGTRFTMEEGFYRNRLKELHGIDVIVPDKDDREAIHDIIFKELILGIIEEESREVFKEVIQKLKANGAQGVILGCTEIPLLIKQGDCDITVLDTTTLHALKAVKLVLD